jgi:PKD repeat protein
VPVPFSPVQVDGDQYHWEITSLGSRQEKNPELTFTVAGAYEVSLKVTKDGCESSLTKIISVDDTKKVLYIPNVFSPWASNPENQVVKVYGSGISTDGFIFRILNRWGNVLYETTTLSVAQNTGWDGKARGTGEMQALGVYTFMLKGKFLDGEVIQRTGSITLVK